MKTAITKCLEYLLYNKFNDRNDFYVFECTLGWYGSEIVDCICYNCQREVTCYEIKSSVADFRSKSAKTFIGNRNYFVMPYSVYEKVQLEIPLGIGVYCSIDHAESEVFSEDKWEIGGTRVSKIGSKAKFIDGFRELICVRNSKRRDLKADKEVILSSMLRCMQRDVFRGSRFAYSEDFATIQDSAMKLISK